MNAFKLKNSKNLSKFNSISQPHLYTQPILLKDTKNFKHSEQKFHGKQMDESTLDDTANFLETIKWTAKPCSLNTIFNQKDQLNLTATYSDCNNSYSDSEYGFDKTSQLPMIIKVIKGSYGVIKEEKSLLKGSKKKVSNLLVYKRVKNVFILCQSLKYKDKKPYVFGSNISIPITYNGWFEILSEDGKSIRPILSIKDLAKHALNANNFKKLFNKPKNNISYIVRESITSYEIPDSSLSSIKIRYEAEEQIASNLKLIECKSVSIKPGDIIQVVGQIYILHSSSSFSYSSKVGICKRIKMFKCLVRRKPGSNHYDPNKTNVPTETLYIPEDTQGKYSPVARIENISGVHKLDDLVKKFRFPVTVQLVYGRAPSESSLFKNPLASSFSPILKLLKIYEEDNILAYPIGCESCLIQVPLRAKLNVVVSQNIRNLISDSTYLRILLNECKILAPEYSDMIYNLPETPPLSVIGVDALSTGIIQSCVKDLIGRSETSKPGVMDKKMQVEKALNLSVEYERAYASNKIDGEVEKEVPDDDNSQIYKQIDDLYEYVRTGVLPEYLEDEANGIKDTNNHMKINSPVFKQNLPRNQSFNSTNKNKKIQINLITNEPSDLQQHLPKLAKTSKVIAIETEAKISFKHHHNNNYTASKERNNSRDESTFNLTIQNTLNKNVNIKNIIHEIDQYKKNLANVNLETSQEIFVEKSNLHKQILAGGMSTSYHYQQEECSSRHGFPIINVNPTDEALNDSNYQVGHRTDKEWFEGLQKLSFDLVKMNESSVRQKKNKLKSSALNKFEKFLMKSNQINFSENLDVKAKKSEELRHYLSLEKLHEIFMNENMEHTNLQQGQQHKQGTMHHHCFL